MAFFSFSPLVDSFDFLHNRLELNQTYYSKDITLWKKLNNKKQKKQLTFIKYENRTRINNIGRKLLICLPPKFGLGDAIEYSIAIKSLIKSNKFIKIGIAFCDDHLFIFKNLFSFSNIYPVVISEKEMDKYDTIFHITLEIEPLKFQKYNRSDIVHEICNYFDVIIYNFKLEKNLEKKSFIKKISIFPVSTSVIRSLPNSIIQTIIDNFSETHQIEIFLDDSDYSKHLKEKNNQNNISIKTPRDISNLVNEISNITFGIFIDSGPLHVAKIFDKPGVLVETSVCSKKLLSNSKNINVIKNKYKSKYCSGPCGLVDIFSFDKSIGCFETNKTSFDTIKGLKSFKSLQRWNKKENNSHFILNPVGCIDKIDIENIIKSINTKLKEI